MSMHRAFPILFLWVVLAGPLPAQTTGYQCNIRGTSDGSWIQPLIFIGLDRETDRVVISDLGILAANDGVPVEGAMVVDNAARTTFAWRLVLRSPFNQGVTVAYRATYLKDSGKVNIAARSHGADAPVTRAGTCKVREISG